MVFTIDAWPSNSWMTLSGTRASPGARRTCGAGRSRSRPCQMPPLAADQNGWRPATDQWRSSDQPIGTPCFLVVALALPCPRIGPPGAPLVFQVSQLTPPPSGAPGGGVPCDTRLSTMPSRNASRLRKESRGTRAAASGRGEHGPCSRYPQGGLGASRGHGPTFVTRYYETSWATSHAGYGSLQHRVVALLRQEIIITASSWQGTSHRS